MSCSQNLICTRYKIQMWLVYVYRRSFGGHCGRNRDPTHTQRKSSSIRRIGTAKDHVQYPTGSRTVTRSRSQNARLNTPSGSNRLGATTTRKRPSRHRLSVPDRSGNSSGAAEYNCEHTTRRNRCDSVRSHGRWCGMRALIAQGRAGTDKRGRGKERRTCTQTRLIGVPPPTDALS